MTKRQFVEALNGPYNYLVNGGGVVLKILTLLLGIGILRSIVIWNAVPGSTRVLVVVNAVALTCLWTWRIAITRRRKRT